MKNVLQFLEIIENNGLSCKVVDIRYFIANFHDIELSNMVWLNLKVKRKTQPFYSHSLNFIFTFRNC